MVGVALQDSLSNSSSFWCSFRPLWSSLGTPTRSRRKGGGGGARPTSKMVVVTLQDPLFYFRCSFRPLRSSLGIPTRSRRKGGGGGARPTSKMVGVALHDPLFHFRERLESHAVEKNKDTDLQSLESPPFKRATEAGEDLKTSIVEMLFPSNDQNGLQVLLDVLTGDAKKDLQKLLDKMKIFCSASPDSEVEICLNMKVAEAREELTMHYPELLDIISSNIVMQVLLDVLTGDAKKDLPKLLDKMKIFCSAFLDSEVDICLNMRATEAGEDLMTSILELPSPSNDQNGLQELLEVQTGHANEDFQKLQDIPLNSCCLSIDSGKETRLQTYGEEVILQITGDEVPSNKDTEDEVPSDKDTGDEVPSDKDTGDEVPSDKVIGDKVPSDKDTGDEVPSDKAIGDKVKGGKNTGDKVIGGVDRRDKVTEGKNTENKVTEGKDTEDKDTGVEITRDKYTRGRCTGDKVTRGKDVGGKDKGSKDTRGKCLRGKNTGGKDTRGKNTGGKDTGNKDAGGKDTGGKDPEGKDPGGKNTGGKDTGGKDTGGKDPGGKKKGGKDTGGKDTGGKDPGGKDTEGKDTEGKDPGGKNTGNKDTGGKDTGYQDIRGKNPGGKDQGGKVTGGKDMRSKDTGGKDTGGKDTGGKDTGGKDTGCKDTGGKGMRGKDRGGKVTRGKDMRGKNTEGKDPGGKDTGDKDTGYKQMRGKDMRGKDTGGKDMRSKDTGGKDTGYQDMKSKDRGSKDIGGKDTGYKHMRGKNPGGKDRGGKVTEGKDTGGKDMRGKDTGYQDRGGKDTGGKDTGGKDTGGKDTGGKDMRGKDTGDKDMRSKDTGGKDTGGKDTGVKDTGGKKMRGKDAGYQDMRSKDTGGKDPGGKDPGGKDLRGKDPGGKHTGGKHTGGKDPGGKDTGGKDTGGKDTGGKNTGNKDAGGKDTGYQDMRGKDPGGKDPGGKDPGGKDMRGKDMRGKDMRGNDTGGKDMRGKDTGGKHTRGKDTRGKDTRGKHTRGKHTGGKHTRGKHTRGKHTGGKHTGGKHTGGKHTGGKHTGGKDMRGKDTGGKDTGGKDMRGKDMRGKDTGGKHTGGKDTGGKDTGGKDTGGKDTGGKDTGDKDIGYKDLRGKDMRGKDRGGKVTGDKDTGDKDAGDKDTGDKDAGDKTAVDLPPSRRGAVEQLAGAGERLKKTPAGPLDVASPSAVKSNLQAAGITAKKNHDFQQFSLARAWKGVVTILVLGVLGLMLLASLLGDEQGAGATASWPVWLWSLLPSVLVIISITLHCCRCGSCAPSWFSFQFSKEHHYCDVVCAGGRWVSSCLCSFLLTVYVSLGRALKRALTSRRLGLLVFASLLGVLAASPLPARPRVQGGGRAEQGQAHSLTCVVEGPGTDIISSYIWYKDGDIIRKETKQALTFTRLTLDDAAMYQCRLKLAERPRILLLSEPVQLIVTGYKVVPRPTVWNEGVPVLHQSFRLRCTVTGFPQNHDVDLSYRWYKDSRQIPGQSGSALQFSRLTREDGGVYSCVATGTRPWIASPKSNDFNFFVLVPPHVRMEPATPDNVIRRAAGEELTLTCKVTEAIPGIPADGYSWSYLPSHHGQRRPLVERESTLRLGPLTREESGQYFCQARNDKESPGDIPPGNASITVDVAYLENITLTPDLEVKEGDHVTLTCSVDSNQAARLAWMLDGQEVRHVTANSDYYVLERAACSDSKTYTCRASNSDLPGLERHASTSVKVMCDDEMADPPPPHPSPSNSTQDDKEAGPDSSQQSWPWGVLAGLAVLAVALAIALVVVVICLCKIHGKRRERDKADPANESCLPKERAKTPSSYVTCHLVADAETGGSGTGMTCSGGFATIVTSSCSTLSTFNCISKEQTTRL